MCPKYNMRSRLGNYYPARPVSSEVAKGQDSLSLLLLPSGDKSPLFHSLCDFLAEHLLA
jgi:hypothetical protein